MSFRYTKKRTEIMRHVCQSLAKGRDLTVAELHDQLSYACTRSALLCSIKFLIQHALVTAEPRGPASMLIKPTAYGMANFMPDPITLPEPSLD